MEIKEERHILRLTIEYPNTSKEKVCEVMDYLDERFSNHGYKIIRRGPKSTGLGTCDMEIGQMVVETEGR